MMNFNNDFISCNASFKCKYKNTSLICGITKIVQFVFHSLWLHIYFALDRIVGKLYKINSTAFISLPDTHTFYQHSLPSALLMSKEGLEKKT